MKSLSNIFKEITTNSKSYHFSYDIIDCERSFKGSYEDALKYLLEKLYGIGVVDIIPHCASTLILSYPIDSDVDIFSTLDEELQNDFRYLISSIDINEMKSNRELSFGNKVLDLWKEITSSK